MSGAGSPGPYWAATAGAGVLLVGLCVAARRRPGRWTRGVRLLLGAALVGEQISWQIQFAVARDWSVHHSLPLDLCDVAAWVGAVACWFDLAWAIEVTWFWGLAGTLQAVVTPDVGATYPHLEFVNYVVGHLGVVSAGVFLVVGLRRPPRRRAVRRMFLLTLGYAAVVGVVDATVNADYLFLKHPPPTASLLNVLGPWPWYLVSCAGLALLSFWILDAPFRFRRLQLSGSRAPRPT